MPAREFINTERPATGLEFLRMLIEKSVGCYKFWPLFVQGVCCDMICEGYVEVFFILIL